MLKTSPPEKPGKPINASKIAGGVFWTTSSYLNDRLLKLVAQMVLARLLTPEMFGLWALVQIQLLFCELLNEYSIAQVLVQRGLDNRRLSNAVFSLGVNVAVALFAFQGVLGYVLSRFFETPLLWPLTAAAGTTFLIRAGASSHRAVMVRQMRFREITLIDALGGAMGLVATLSGAAAGIGVWAFVAGNLTLATVTSLGFRYRSGYGFRYHLFPDGEMVREVRGFVSGILGTHLATYTNNNTDTLIIGKLLGTGQLGQYNLAYQLAMLPVFVFSKSHTVNFSVLSQASRAQKQAYVAKALELNALLFGLVYSGAFVAAPWLLPWLYGPQWQPASLLFQILLVYAYSRLFMKILGVSLNADNRSGTNALMNWLLIPLSVPAYFVGAHFGGTVGVALAVALAMGLGGTLCCWYLTCKVSRWQLGGLLRPVLLPTGAIVLTLAAATWLPGFALLPEYLKPPAAIAIYLFTVTVGSRGRLAVMLWEVFQQSLPKKLLLKRAKK